MSVHNFKNYSIGTSLVIVIVCSILVGKDPVTADPDPGERTPNSPPRGWASTECTDAGQEEGMKFCDIATILKYSLHRNHLCDPKPGSQISSLETKCGKGAKCTGRCSPSGNRRFTCKVDGDDTDYEALFCVDTPPETVAVIVAVVLGCLLALVVVGIIIWCLLRRRRKSAKMTSSNGVGATYNSRNTSTAPSRHNIGNPLYNRQSVKSTKSNAYEEIPYGGAVNGSYVKTEVNGYETILDRQMSVKSGTYEVIRDDPVTVEDTPTSDSVENEVTNQDSEHTDVANPNTAQTDEKDYETAWGDAVPNQNSENINNPDYLTIVE